MRHGWSLALALSTSLLAVACTDDPKPPVPTAVKTAGYVTVDAEKICRIFTTDCARKNGQTLDDCVKIYEAARVPTSCTATLDALTCDTPQSALDACWPSCSDAIAECDGPNIIECASSGRRYTYDCDGVCATQGKTWSGTCAAAYKAQTSPRNTCWCN